MREKQECPKCGAAEVIGSCRISRRWECGTTHSLDPHSPIYGIREAKECTIAALTAENARLSAELKAEREKGERECERMREAYRAGQYGPILNQLHGAILCGWEVRISAYGENNANFSVEGRRRHLAHRRVLMIDLLSDARFPQDVFAKEIFTVTQPRRDEDALAQPTEAPKA